MATKTRSTKKNVKVKGTQDSRISLKKHNQIIYKINDSWRKQLAFKEETLMPKNQCESETLKKEDCKMESKEASASALVSITVNLKENNDVLTDRLNDLRYSVGNIKQFEDGKSHDGNSEEKKDKIIPDVTSSMRNEIDRARILIYQLTEINNHLRTII